MEQQMKLNIDLSKTLPIVCEKCGSQTFQESILIRKASKFITGTAQDAIIPIPTFTCTQCGHANEEFLPTDLKSNIQ
jgi:uncharacterized Zn finger protein